MAKRVPFPEDVCSSPDARYYRTLAEAFPCGPREAIAVQRFEPPRAWIWIVLAVLVLVLGIVAGLAGCSAQAADAPTTTAAADIKQIARDAFACPWMTAVWLDEVTVQCLKEKP